MRRSANWLAQCSSSALTCPSVTRSSRDRLTHTVSKTGDGRPCDPAGVSEIEVRAAGQDDLEVLLALYAELTDGTPSAAAGDHEISNAALQRVLAQPYRHLLVAVLDGRVAGTADLAIVPNITHRGTPWGIVENVVVTGAARRRGVARALFVEIERIARAAGCHKVGLLSGNARVEAHSFYRSVGYEPVCEGFKLYLDR
jgi:GNAT superfamily N-acetyltransferase